MRHNLAIFTELAHDGDGTVKYRVFVESGAFQAETELWGGPMHAAQLSTALRAFQPVRGTKLDYSLGSPGTGTVELRFEVVDLLGHCRLWTSVVSDHRIAGTGEQESARVCFGFAPADIDEFCRQLDSFVPNHPNRAELSGHAA